MEWRGWKHLVTHCTFAALWEFMALKETLYCNFKNASSSIRELEDRSVLRHKALAVWKKTLIMGCFLGGKCSFPSLDVKHWFSFFFCLGSHRKASAPSGWCWIIWDGVWVCHSAGTVLGCVLDLPKPNDNELRLMFAFLSSSASRSLLCFSLLVFLLSLLFFPSLSLMPSTSLTPSLYLASPHFSCLLPSVFCVPFVFGPHLPLFSSLW